MQTKDIYINGEKTQYAINLDGTLINTKTGRFLKSTVPVAMSYLNSPIMMVSIVMYVMILDIINFIYLETYQIAG